MDPVSRISRGADNTVPKDHLQLHAQNQESVCRCTGNAGFNGPNFRRHGQEKLNSLPTLVRYSYRSLTKRKAPMNEGLTKEQTPSQAWTLPSQ